MNRDTTMLELVREVSREVQSDVEVVKRVTSLVNSGRVRLVGSFRGTTLLEGPRVQPRANSERRSR